MNAPVEAASRLVLADSTDGICTLTLIAVSASTRYRRQDRCCGRCRAGTTSKGPVDPRRRVAGGRPRVLRGHDLNEMRAHIDTNAARPVRRVRK